ncbi:MAG: hypothetical protein WCY89_02435 [Flavobacteriaceae bacterium]
MKTLKYIIAPFLLISGVVSAQESEVTLFDTKLNQFLNVRDFCISENENEAFFTIQSPDGKISQVVSITKEKTGWSEPVLMPFCDENMYMEPFLTYDGKRLFFVSDRPNNSSTDGKKNFDIWYVERKNQSDKWSEPINLGSPINSELDEFYPTLSENSNLYFTLDSPTGMGKDDIYMSQWNGKNYDTPVLLSDKVNSEGYEFNAFISKDESFLLYTKYNAAGGLGSGDLYISRKDAQGNWQQVENLGEKINTVAMEYCPFYDQKSQTLYFTSRRNLLSPRKFANLAEFQQYVNSSNGLSKIYKIKIQL